MQKAILYTEDGTKKEVYLMEDADIKATEKDKKMNLREHLYTGFLIVGIVSFSLGIYLTFKKINGTQ